MKLITIVGARPQIIKAAAISRAISNHFADKIQEMIVHTGQHYDQNMSQVFFDELGIPQPAYNLEIGSDERMVQIKKMQEGLENIISKEKPNVLLVYGDTNSTLAGALAANKFNIPIVHVEAGLRSFNREMPEELNRIETDELSTLLFSPTETGLKNLINEGFSADTLAPFSKQNKKIYHCGDIMLDNAWYYSAKDFGILERLNVNSPYVLATVHRNTNTDKPELLNAIFDSLLKIAKHGKHKVLLPLHPRTKKMLELNAKELFAEICAFPDFLILEPMSYIEVLSLEKNADLVITDSGGVQKEAYYFETRCLVLRDETEWVEILETKNAKLCPADKNDVFEEYQNMLNMAPMDFPPLFGDGKAAEFICNEILTQL